MREKGAAEVAWELFEQTGNLSYYMLYKRLRVDRKKTEGNTMEFKADALLLRAVDYGENDRIATLLTAERGKISAALKGGKKGGRKTAVCSPAFLFSRVCVGCARNALYGDGRLPA